MAWYLLYRHRTTDGNLKTEVTVVAHGDMGAIRLDVDKAGPKSWVDPFRNAGIKLTSWTMKYVPDTWVIAVALNIIIAVMALIWGKTTAVGAIYAWGKGFWALLTLMAQFTFSIVVAYVCASAPVVVRSLNWLGSRTDPDRPWQAILFMVIFSCFTGWLNWAVTVVASAMFAPFLAKHNPKTDYRLIVASAYVGIATNWHSGLSASAPLIVATGDNFLIKAKILTDVIPVSRTIFASYNFVLIAISFVVVAVVFTLMTPRPEQAQTLPKKDLDELTVSVRAERPENMTVAQKINWGPYWNLIFGTACLVYIFLSFRESGLAAWTIDMYNWVFLTLALFLTWRPVVFLNGCKQGILGAWGIIVQFPIYGGIFGLVSFTNLGHFLTNIFTSIATPQTFLPIIYWYSGILSYFVPSGGSKWAIEAPYLIPAAQQLAISPATTTLVYGWGDMLTHLLQPFWAIPLLAITRTSFGQIAGFSAVLFVIYAIVLTIAMFFVPLNL
jgi:short-chain fatty acids transporter